MASKQHGERIEELRKDIENGVKELRNSGTWQRYLDFMGRFHQYSWNNILLMLMQSNGNSSLVAGFRQWQTRGRVVRKGEHGMKIFGFSTRTVKDEDGNPQLDENGDPIQKVWYPILTVFDVSQTDPIDKETDPIEQMKPSELEGADALGLVGRMTAWLESKHWRVGHEPMGRDVKGYTTMDGSRRIMLNEQNSPRQDAKTILHETAHMLLHQGLPEGEYGRHRGIYETEAESVAYVVAKYMGMDTGEYSIRYVAGWSDADLKLVRSTAEHVRKAADEIITALHG